MPSWDKMTRDEAIDFFKEQFEKACDDPQVHGEVRESLRMYQLTVESLRNTTATASIVALFDLLFVELYYRKNVPCPEVHYLVAMDENFSTAISRLGAMHAKEHLLELIKDMVLDPEAMKERGRQLLLERLSNDVLRRLGLDPEDLK